MHRAFVRAEDDTARLGLAYNVVGSTIASAYPDENVNDLVGYRHGTGPFHAITLTAAQDNYERLAAAIAYYNSPSNLVAERRRSWPNILKYLKNSEGSTGNSTEEGIYHSGKYSIDVRSAIFGDNLRTYIWQGTGTGLGLDINDNGVIDTVDDPNTPQNDALEATTQWCFAYGESEWANPAFKVEDDEGNQISAGFDDYKNRAANIISHRVACN